MKKALLSGKIKCLRCGKNFKAKLQNGTKRVYIDSDKDRGGSCSRNQLDQEFLLSLITRRFERELNEDEIKEYVEKIEVDGEEFKIYIKGQHPIEIGGNTFVF